MGALGSLVQKATSWERVGRPLIIAHRGASARELENTVPAFARAREEGADGVELDVLLCKTGEVVVFHDDDLKRLAGRPENVEDVPWSELRQVPLVLGERRGCIPLLSSVLEELGPGMLVNIELKAPRARPYERLAWAVADLLRRHGVGVRFLVSSFNPLALLALRTFSPSTPLALLMAKDQSLPLRAAWARGFIRPVALHPEHALVHGSSREKWRREGYAVNAWTVDDPREIARLCSLDIDGLITNRPAETREVVEGLRAR
ncbi:MAG: glycerophosphodiester phosphodiesterase [Deltaproteobacteria bacterium]|nr:glycerophosphodiester phosphodiesterase [Deltaproteobacteria bacterium]